MGHLFGRPRETEGDSTYERRALKALRMQSGPDEKLFQHQKKIESTPQKTEKSIPLLSGCYGVQSKNILYYWGFGVLIFCTIFFCSMVIFKFSCHKYLAKQYFCLKVFLVDISWHNIILESMEGESDEGGQLMQSFLYDVPPCPPSSLFVYLQCTNVFFDKSSKMRKTDISK